MYTVPCSLPACLSACLPARPPWGWSCLRCTSDTSVETWKLSLWTKVVCKVTLSFTPCPLCLHPCPLFQWYLQSKEILLNLTFDALLCQNWSVLPPNRLTLQITLLSHVPLSLIGVSSYLTSKVLSPSSVYLYKQDLVKDHGTPLGTRSGWRVPERNDDRGEK
jgi:hypothetical protein